MKKQKKAYVETRRPSGSAVAWARETLIQRCFTSRLGAGNTHSALLQQSPGRGKHSFSAASPVAYVGKPSCSAPREFRVETQPKIPTDQTLTEPYCFISTRKICVW